MPSIPALPSSRPTHTATETAGRAVLARARGTFVLLARTGSLPTLLSTYQFLQQTTCDHSPDPTTDGRDAFGDEGCPAPGRPPEHDPRVERPGPPALLPDQPSRRPALPAGRPAAIPRCRRSRRHGQLALRPGRPTRPGRRSWPAAGPDCRGRQ